MVAALSQVNGLGEKVFHPDIKADFAKALAFNYQVTVQNPDGGWGHQMGAYLTILPCLAPAATLPIPDQNRYNGGIVGNLNP